MYNDALTLHVHAWYSWGVLHSTVCIDWSISAELRIIFLCDWICKNLT